MTTLVAGTGRRPLSLLLVLPLLAVTGCEPRAEELPPADEPMVGAEPAPTAEHAAELERRVAELEATALQLQDQLASFAASAELPPAEGAEPVVALCCEAEKAALDESVNAVVSEGGEFMRDRASVVQLEVALEDLEEETDVEQAGRLVEDILIAAAQLRQQQPPPMDR